MSNAIYKKDLHDVALAVAQGSKDYTDKTKEEIYWHIGDYSISTQTDNTTASTKTVPSNATRCKIKRIYGLTQKFNPTTAYDDASTMTKTMPNVVYDFDCSIVYGNSEVSENLIVLNDVAETTVNGITYKVENGVITLNGTATDTTNILSTLTNFVAGMSIYLFNPTANGQVFFQIRDSADVWIEDVYLNAANKSATLNNNGAKFNIRIASGQTLTNFIIKPMLVKDSTAPTEFKQGFEGIHNLELSGLVVKNSDDEVMQNISIDLSTILYNGSPLFEGNSLKRVGTAKDYIAPYKAHKEVILTTNTTNFVYVDGYTKDNIEYAHFRLIVADSSLLPYASTFNILSNISFDAVGGSFSQRSGTWIGSASGTNVNWAFQLTMPVSVVGDTTALIRNYFTANPLVLIYELATPIEVSIDWSSTLRGIQGYSNGTITLQNTYNMDTANTITYNSIIKENCCAKIVQSRGGNVVKTINLPTQASDGYSAGSVNNVRDLTTSKRGTNVNKNNSLGGLGFSYVSDTTRFFSSDLASLAKLPTNNDTVANLLSKDYDIVYLNYLIGYPNLDKLVALSNTGNLSIRDLLYIDANIFKLANANQPLYYELKDTLKTESDIAAIDNIIEVQPNDVLSFYDSNDNLVTVPSDLTYRIEVERV